LVVPSVSPTWIHLGGPTDFGSLWVVQGTQGTTDTLIRFHMTSFPFTVDVTFPAYPFDHNALGLSLDPPFTLGYYDRLWVEIVDAGAGLIDLVLQLTA
jgi:hypothetical protein